MFRFLGLTALLIFSWLSLFFLPAGSRDARGSFKGDTGVVTLVFCVVAVLVWYWSKTGYPRAASLTLYGFYVIVLGWLLWAVKKANWR